MLSLQSSITDAPEQLFSCHALRISPDQELLNYISTTYTDGSDFLPKSSAIEIPVLLLILGKPSPKSLGLNKIYPLHSTLKPMDFLNERTNGLNNTSTPSSLLTQKIGPIG